MNYLFFDIECAGIVGGVSRICSFGYFLCDENYNKIEKNDIIINPRCRIESGKLKKSGVTFAYPDEHFKKFPDFSSTYAEIQRLLTLPDTLIIGHATGCDASYILQNARYFELPPFDFLYLDTQKLHAFAGGAQFVSLPHLCEIYGAPILREHKSDDDAEMTAHIAKLICKKYGFDLKSSSKKLSLLGCVHNGCNHTDLSSAFPIGSGFLMTPHVRRVFRSYLSSRALGVTPKPNFRGTKYCFDENFDHFNFKSALWLAHQLRLRGAMYTTNVLDCDVFVDFPSSSEKHGRKLIAKSLHKKIITQDTLLSSLGVDIPDQNDIDTDEILGSTVNSREWYEYYKKEIKKAP